MTTETHPGGGKVYEFGISDRIRAVREEAGLDQSELADRTGLSRASISNYERGSSNPRKSAVLLIAMATGYDPDWLATGAAEGPTDGTPTRWFGVLPSHAADVIPLDGCRHTSQTQPATEVAEVVGLDAWRAKKAS